MSNIKFLSKTPITNVVGELLSQIRVMHKEKQFEFANRIGFNSKLISSLENGRSLLNINNWIYLCHQLNVDSSLFLDLLKIYLDEFGKNHIYVYLPLSSVSLIYQEQEILELKDVENSYSAVYTFFNFFDESGIDKDKFDSLKETDTEDFKKVISSYRLKASLKKHNLSYQSQKLLEKRENLMHKQQELNSKAMNCLHKYDLSVAQELISQHEKIKQEINKIDKRITRVVELNRATRPNGSLNDGFEITDH